MDISSWSRASSADDPQYLSAIQAHRAGERGKVTWQGHGTSIQLTVTIWHHKSCHYSTNRHRINESKTHSKQPDLQQSSQPPNLIFDVRCIHSSSKYTNSTFGRGSAPDPAGEAYHTMLPRPPCQLGRGYPIPVPSTPSVPQTVSWIYMIDLLVTLNKLATKFTDSELIAVHCKDN